MSQLLIPSMFRSNCRHAGFAALLACSILLVASIGAQAQTLPPPPQPPSDSSTNSPSDAAQSNIFNTPASPDFRVALPADKIMSILDQQPEVVVELKSLLAEQMQKQGTQIDQNDISDETLYSQIASSATLRANVTAFLRARGYVSAEDLQNISADTDGVDDELARQGLNSPGQERSSSRGDVSGSEQQLSSAASNLQGQKSNSANSSASTGNMGATAIQQASRYRQSNSTSETVRQPAVSASTDEPQVLRQPAPYNLRSLRDLYTQIPEPDAKLKRFGADVFVNRGNVVAARSNANYNAPLDVPMGPDYILGPGDTLTISIWGGVTESITRLIDRDGRILLPEAGSINVGGLSLEHAQNDIATALAQQYRNARVAVAVTSLRSVHVYVVGDVQRPGAYEVSAQATPLSALYAAGGPTAAGSLRTLQHFRGKQLVETVDLYDFLLHGIRSGSARFESGDTLLVPPAGPQVAVSGAVKRPAIYELKGASTLTEVVSDAGGFTASAAMEHITVERIDAHLERETVTLDLTGEPDIALGKFTVSDGDRVRVGTILPYSERAVYLDGHVARPGRKPYHDGMRLSDVLKSYQDMLPEPASHGEIVRLVAPDLHAEMIEFNLPDVLIGNENIVLLPFDTIRIFGRYERDAPKVTISGEIQRPGSYPLSAGMTAAQLVRMAGGFKRDALLDSADLASYTIAGGTRVVDKLELVSIGAAVNGKDASADVPLKAGDVLTIHQITGWEDIGQSIKIEGEVAHPGSYGFSAGERLSSVLRRAGGFRDTAYPGGAVLTREQVRELEMKSRADLIRQIETSSASARLAPTLAASDSAATMQLIQAQQDQILARLKSQPPTGRLVVHISADIDSWANTSADIEVRRGDVITIPKTPSFVLVTGQVYNATALTFTPGMTAGWYLRHAGGTNNTANRKEIFVVRANGSVIGRHSGGWHDGDVLSTKLDPGDVIVVPQKILGNSVFWRNLLTVAQLASSAAITVAVATL